MPVFNSPGVTTVRQLREARNCVLRSEEVLAAMMCPPSVCDIKHLFTSNEIINNDTNYIIANLAFLLSHENNS